MKILKKIAGAHLIAFCLSNCQAEKTIRIGNVSGRQWEWVDAPVDVVHHAQTQIDAHVKSWNVAHLLRYRDTSFADMSFDIVCFNDDNFKNYVCTVVSGKWTWVGGPRGLATISSLYRTQLGRLHAGIDVQSTIRLCNDIAYLHRGPYRKLLTNHFKAIDLGDGSVDGWLHGSARNADALRKYCNDPVIKKEQSSFAITFHMVTGQGSVEHWTIRTSGKESDFAIVDIDIHQVEKPGTFSCPDSGSN